MTQELVPHLGNYIDEFWRVAVQPGGGFAWSAPPSQQPHVLSCVPSYALSARSIPRDSPTIGRRHKPHRGQPQDTGGRNEEEGRNKSKSKSKNNNNKNKNRGQVGRLARMGQDESRLVDEKTPPQTLKSRTLEAVAEHIKDGKARRIVVMVGASAAHTVPRAQD